MDRFKIKKFWEDTSSLIWEEFVSLEAETKARVIKRIEIFERKTINQLFREKQLEKVEGATVKMYELRLRITPPVRMLGVLEKSRYIPIHLFIKKDEQMRPKDIQTATERIKRYYQ